MGVSSRPPNELRSGSGERTSVNFLAEATKLVRYFRRLDEAVDGEWSSQLLWAQIWQSFIESGADVPRSVLLAEIRSTGRDRDLGTGFEELAYWVGRWAESGSEAD